MEKKIYMGIESLINKEEQAHKMLRSFLLELISKGKCTYEDCQLLMMVDDTDLVYFKAVDSKGYIKDGEGKTKIFKAKDIAGLLTYASFGSFIEEFLSELILGVKDFFKLTNKELSMQVFIKDKDHRELQYFVLKNNTDPVNIIFSETDYLSDTIDAIRDEIKPQKHLISKEAYFDVFKSKIEAITNTETYKSKFFIFKFDIEDCEEAEF